MEHAIKDVSSGKNLSIKEKEATESNLPKDVAKSTPDPAVISPEGNAGVKKAKEWQTGGVLFKDRSLDDVDPPAGEVNMEASISPEDVIRAGGFGARDDISSFLPVASDSTDFEELIRDARGYEEAQAEVRRPGLGWTRE